MPPRPDINGTRAAQFGPAYEQLLRTAWAEAPFRFPCADERTMRAMRAKVYTYFRWLREENLRLDLIEMADGLTLAMEGTVLVFNHNAKTWDNRLIEERLGLTSGPTGLQPLPGNNSELKQPDLLHTRLTRQLQGIRERKAGGAGIVPPFKSAKNIVDS